MDSNSPDAPLSFHCFIDTNIFEKHKFNLAGPHFQSLLQRTKIGHTFLFTTEVTLDEISSRWKKNFQEHASNYDTFKNLLRKHTVLPNQISNEFLSLDMNKLICFDIGKEVRKFYSESGAPIIPSNQIRADHVLRKYFAHEPPFDHQKNKSEFPDGFMIDLIEQFHDSVDRDIHIISNDGGFKNFANSTPWAHIYNSLHTYLESHKANADSQAEAMSNAIKTQLDSIKTKLLSHANSIPIYYTNAGREFSMHKAPHTRIKSLQLRIPDRWTVEHDDNDLYICRMNVTIDIDGSVKGKRSFPGDPTPWHMTSNAYQDVVADIQASIDTQLSFFITTNDAANSIVTPYAIEFLYKSDINSIALDGDISNIKPI